MTPISNFGWQDSPSVATPLDAANLEAFGQSLGAYADAKDLVPTTSQNASGSFQVAPQAFVVLDTTNFGGTSTPLLPNAPVNGTRVAVRWAKGANAVTVQRQGSDVIFAGGSVTATSVALLLAQTMVFQYVNATATWHVFGDVPTELIPSVVNAGIQYVSTNGDDANNGFSLTLPKLSLNSAYNALPGTGGVINVGAGVFNHVLGLTVSKPNVTIKGSGIDITKINMAIPGTYITAPTGSPVVASPGTTLSGSQTLPANGGSTTLNVASTTNLTGNGTTIFLGGPTDSVGFGTANTRSYPFAQLLVTGSTSTTVTVTVTSGGSITYTDQAVVVNAVNGILPNAANFKMRDLTIDGSACLGTSGTYPLNVLSTAPDSVVERCLIIGYANASLGPNFYILVAAPRFTWRYNRSVVRFNGSTCVDCRAHDNIINCTSGFNQMFQIGGGANNIHIYDNYIKNTVALNASGGQANGVRVNGSVTTSTLSANAAQGTTSVTVTSVSGWSIGQTLMLANNLGVQTLNVSGPWETKTISNIVGSVVSFITPLEYGFTAGMQASAITYANDIYIHNNRIIDTLQAGISVGVASHSTVTNNIVTGSGRLRPDAGPSVDNVDIQGSHDIHVSNNKIAHSGGYGINVSNTAVSPGGSNVRVISNKIIDCGDPAVTFQAVNDCIMEANEIVGCPIGVSIGEAASAAQRIKILRNTFRDCDWFGFGICGSSGCIVMGNDFINCGWEGSVRGQGDFIGIICDGHWLTGSGGSIGNKVIGNTIGRSAQQYSASSLEFADFVLADEGGVVWLTGVHGLPVPAGGAIPKYFVRSTSFGTGQHTTANGSVTLPSATIAVTSTSGFSAGGGVLYFYASNTIWTGVRVAYTGISGNTFTGCTGGTGTFLSGSPVGDSLWPTVFTGYNEIRDNYISHIGRRTPVVGQGSDVITNNYISANSELIFDFETTAGTVGGTGNGALNADHTQGANSYQLNTTGAGNIAFAVFSTGLAAGWLAKIADLPEDAEFEIDLKLLDANLASASFRFAQDTGSTNIIDSGPLYASNTQVQTPHLEPTATGWVTYRWRKGDMAAGGTATWANVINFELSIAALSGVASSVRADNLVVVRAG